MAEYTSPILGRGLAILRLGTREWKALRETRQQGNRFSLIFGHELARAGSRKALVLLSIGKYPWDSNPDSDWFDDLEELPDEPPGLKIGIVRSVQAVSTFDSRVVFDLIQPIKPDSLDAVLSRITRSALRSGVSGLQQSTAKYERVSEKLGRELITLIAEEPANAAALRRINAYFCQGWTGWLFVTWMPSLLQKNYGLDLKKSSFLYAGMLFCAMIAELLGGVVTDYLFRRTRSLQIARSLLIAASWGFVLAGLAPAILIHDLVIGLAGFTVALFFLGVAIAPLWTATMDIAPNYAGSSSALMNAAGAVAGILSPVAFGWILDRTGSWTAPFVFSVGLLLFAIVMTYRIRPDRPIDGVPSVGGLAVAGK